MNVECMNVRAGPGGRNERGAARDRGGRCHPQLRVRVGSRGAARAVPPREDVRRPAALHEQPLHPASRHSRDVAEARLPVGAPRKARHALQEGKGLPRALRLRPRHTRTRPPHCLWRRHLREGSAAQGTFLSFGFSASLLMLIR